MVLPKQFMGTPVKCKCTPASSSIDFTTPNPIGIGAAGTGFCKLQGIAKCEIFQVGSMEFLLFFSIVLGFGMPHVMRCWMQDTSDAAQDFLSLQNLAKVVKATAIG
jgi:hypothetical protein